jgi:aryl-alcohol dehydrogenase-like predicted oxidoreductase
VKLLPREGTGALAAALARLGLPSVDSLLLHNAGAADLTDPGLAQRLVRVREEGRVARVGASTYGVDDARSAIRQPWCDTVQVEHSILNPSVVRAIAGDKRPGQEIVVRSVLCKGLLSDRRHDASVLGAAERAALEGLAALAREWGCDMSGLAVRFALDTPGVDVVLVGVASRVELAAALAAAHRPPLAGWQRNRLAEFDHSLEDWTHPERWQVPA